jgi:hypothetical protein
MTILTDPKQTRVEESAPPVPEEASNGAAIESDEFEARLAYSRGRLRRRLTREQIRQRLHAAAQAEAVNPPEQDELVMRARSGEFGDVAFAEKHGTPPASHKRG